MKTKTILSAIVLATAALGSQAVYADDISNPPEALTLVDDSAFFGALFTGNNMGNTFADQYTFTTTSLGAIGADLTSLTGNANVGLDITGFALYGSGGLVMDGTMVSTGAVDQWTLNTGNVAAGEYYLQVSGSMVSRSAGKYYANVTLAPVPEPETYAMMLGGLGLLAFTARRRRAGKGEAV